MPAASLLFRSSKLLDFQLVARGCHQGHCRGATLLFRSSEEPPDFGVARLSLIPRPATCLLFRSSKPLDFRLVTRGCPQYHCRWRACICPQTQPRDFGVARLSLIPRPATRLLSRSSKPLDFRLVARGCHQYHCRRRQSADLVSCIQIVVSTLVVVVAMKNSVRFYCEMN